MTKMTDDELVSLAMLELRNSQAWNTTKLSGMRKKALDYYMAKAEGDLSPPEIEGRSSVVSTDVRDTIEWMMPQLMATFCGGDTVVEFEPSKPGDEQKAQQATDYMNYIFFKRNDGFNNAYVWMKDALLQKNGIIKVWWDTSDVEKKEEYRGLNVTELTELMDDPEVEVIEQRSYPDEETIKQMQQAGQQMQGQLAQAAQAAQQGNQQAAQAASQMQQQLAQLQAQDMPMLYDVTCKRVIKGGKMEIDNIPPEEFFICRDAKDIQSARWVAQGTQRTRSDLRSMGFKNVDDIGGGDTGQSTNFERVNRKFINDEMAYASDELASNQDESKVWVYECYMRVDQDGDGISELRKLTIAGDQLLDNEEVDEVPFISICPVIIPHTFFGLSVADLAMESQKTKTSIKRSLLDNTYLEVNGRYYAVENQANLDDLLYSKPGGVVRVKQAGAVGRLDQGTGNSAAALQMLEVEQNDLETRTGWTRYSQGNDANGLSQNTATGVDIITNRADMRMDLICRLFADGYVKLFRMLLKLVCQHQNKREKLMISGNWVEFDPREWRNMFDVNINVGLGTGNKSQRVQHLMMLAQMQEKVIGMGLADPHKVYNLLTDLTRALGYKSGDKFFNDPAKTQPPPQQPHPDQIKAQAQMQVEQAKIQAQMQLEQMKVQAEKEIEQSKAELQAQVDRNRQEQEARQHALKVQAEMESQLQLAQIESADKQADREMERYKADLDAQTKILIEQMRLGQKHQEVQLGAQIDMQKHDDARQDAALYKQMEGQEDANESRADDIEGA